jgi:hypothetical protein
MLKLKGAVISEEEFPCTTLKDAARILNVIGLLAEVYKRPEPIRFLAALGRALAKRADAEDFRPRRRAAE